jgi:hypothetical protein
MSDWKALRDVFGAELHRLDSRGPGFLADPSCVECGKHDDVRYRCMECHGDDMVCSSCMLSIHDRSPLHHIQVSRWPFLIIYEITSQTGVVRWVFRPYLAARHGRHRRSRPPTPRALREPNTRSFDVHRHSHERPSSPPYLVLRLRRSTGTFQAAHAVSSMAGHYREPADSCYIRSAAALRDTECNWTHERDGLLPITRSFDGRKTTDTPSCKLLNCLSTVCSHFLGSRARVPQPCSSVATHEDAQAGDALLEAWRRCCYRRWRPCGCVSIVPHPRHQPATELVSSGPTVSPFSAQILLPLTLTFSDSSTA